MRSRVELLGENERNFKGQAPEVIFEMMAFSTFLARRGVGGGKNCGDKNCGDRPARP